MPAAGPSSSTTGPCLDDRIKMVKDNSDVLVDITPDDQCAVLVLFGPAATGGEHRPLPLPAYQGIDIDGRQLKSAEPKNTEAEFVIKRDPYETQREVEPVEVVQDGKVYPSSCFELSSDEEDQDAVDNVDQKGIIGRGHEAVKYAVIPPKSIAEQFKTAVAERANDEVKLPAVDKLVAAATLVPYKKDNINAITADDKPSNADKAVERPKAAVAAKPATRKVMTMTLRDLIVECEAGQFRDIRDKVCRIAKFCDLAGIEVKVKYTEGDVYECQVAGCMEDEMATVESFGDTPKAVVEDAIKEFANMIISGA